jgi:hypothetical protein
MLLFEHCLSAQCIVVDIVPLNKDTKHVHHAAMLLLTFLIEHVIKITDRTPFVAFCGESALLRA